LSEIPHERIFVAEVARLRDFYASICPNFGKFGYTTLLFGVMTELARKFEKQLPFQLVPRLKTLNDIRRALRL